MTGANVSHQWNSELLGDRVVNTIGLQVRNDDIPHVGLHHTEDQQLVNVVTDDKVDEFNAGLYGQSEMKWAEKVRTIIGRAATGITRTWWTTTPRQTPAGGRRRSSAPRDR